jgi:hypothetical protein
MIFLECSKLPCAEILAESTARRADASPGNPKECKQTCLVYSLGYKTKIVPNKQ